MNKTLLAYILTIGICGVAGGGTGIILKRTLGPIDEHYPPGFDPSEFSPNVSEIMSRYDKLSDKSINGVRSFSDPDIINIVLEKYKTCENCYSVGIGVANTIVTQTIRNAQIKQGNEYFEESVSYSSVVSLANRVIQHGADGNIDFYSGSASGEESASYVGATSTSFTKEEYKSKYGRTLDEMFIYIISEKTLLESNRKSNGDETIFELNLNPNLSTFYYKTQMMNMSGLSNLPPFTEVKLKFTVKSDLSLKHMSVDETFTATKEGIPVPAKTQNILDYYYFANQVMEIPSLDQSIDFSAIAAQEA